MEKYNPQKIERRWQNIWAKRGIYKTLDQKKGRKNFYHLVMFPYPSGDLHIGHWFSYAPADVYARFKRMQGFNVMSPFGFDAFGLPAENAAIKRGIHPKTWTYQNIARMRKQLKSIGAVYDWSREIITCDPSYYKWTQWMFLQLYKAGLAFRARVPANWCPSCKTILANEQVVEGKCERCDSEVRQKEVEQWLFRITNYAEALLKDLEKLDWPERTKTMQRNWIGRSAGAELKFKIQKAKCKIAMQNSKFIKVFTTRADTIFGCTYLVVAPEHPIIENLKSEITNYQEVKNYIAQSQKKTERERLVEAKEKTGVKLEGITAINPANNKEIPVFIADYVLMGYGTGAIMGVPSHDRRDMEFALKYGLSVIEVVRPSEMQNAKCKNQNGPLFTRSKSKFKIREKTYVYEGEGILINSGQFNGLQSKEAMDKIGRWLTQKGLAQKRTYYKLRDWIVSRQRYWGAPIPMIYCQKCGWVPVQEKDLPVRLPELKDFRPSQDGRSPLARSKSFRETTCPKCHTLSERETDTLDTFVCSSWYFLRYTDPKNEKRFADPQKIQAWLPVNMYIGGAEHTVMHLLYARFFTKALQKLSFLDFSEPFQRLHHQGIILGPDGQKMSKSRGNVIDPDVQVAKYGADTVRLYLCFMGPYEQGGPWNPRGIEGIARFLRRVWNLIVNNPKSQIPNPKKIPSPNDQNSKIKKLLHRTIKKVMEDIENFRFNTAISALMVLVNQMQQQKNLRTSDFKLLLLLLAPFAPHLAEELWSSFAAPSPKRLWRVGDKVMKDKHFIAKNSIHNQPWPGYNPALIKERKITLIVQVNGRVRAQIESDRGIAEKDAQKLALEHQKVQKWLEGKQIKKVIFVPEKLINLVIN